MEIEVKAPQIETYEKPTDEEIEEMKKDIDEGYRTIDDKPDKC